MHTGDVIEIDLETGKIADQNGNTIADGSPLGAVQKDIYFAGGLMQLAQKL